MKKPFAGSYLVALAATMITTAPHAELSEDVHITDTGEIQLDANRRAFEEFQRFFRLGYPPATVMMHAVASGMTIGDTVYLAVTADRQRAQEFHDTAVSLLPSLPGWACNAGDAAERYQRRLDPDSLGPQPTIAAVANQFFEHGRRLTPFPDWPGGNGHFEAPVSELVALVDSSKFWYRAGEDDGTGLTAPSRVVPVGVYQHNQSIVVDKASVPRILAAQRNGRETLPVLIVYNESDLRYISEFAPDVEVKDIAEAFFGEGLELTAVPEWQGGDSHKLATIAELEAVVPVPGRDQVPPAQWDAIRQQIEANGGLAKPLLLTLFRSGEGRVWVDSPATLAVAKELNVEPLPVTMLFHELDRLPCGAPTSCDDTICEAAVAAGAGEEICTTSANRSARNSKKPGAGVGATGSASKSPPAATAPNPS